MLKIPYLLIMTGTRPINQTKGEEKKKKTNGSLKTLIANLLIPAISIYCLCVKRMVWLKSTLSRFPKCLW